MLTILPTPRVDPRPVLELPFAAMHQYPGTVVAIDPRGSSALVGGDFSNSTFDAQVHWISVALTHTF